MHRIVELPNNCKYLWIQVGRELAGGSIAVFWDQRPDRRPGRPRLPERSGKATDGRAGAESVAARQSVIPRPASNAQQRLALFADRASIDHGALPEHSSAAFDPLREEMTVTLGPRWLPRHLLPSQPTSWRESPRPHRPTPATRIGTPKQILGNQQCNRPDG
jgi:hypothetical protein